MAKRALSPAYKGKWVQKVGDRCIGEYAGDHEIPPEIFARIVGMAAKSMKDLFESGIRTKTAPMAMTGYQKANRKLYLGSSGEGEHGEEAIERAAGGFNGGTAVTYSFKDRVFTPACKVRGCAGNCRLAMLETSIPR